MLLYSTFLLILQPFHNHFMNTGIYFECMGHKFPADIVASQFQFFVAGIFNPQDIVVHAPFSQFVFSSAKKRAHKAAERALGASEHMAWVKSLPCICCGAVAPSEAHHVTGDKMPRSDFRVIPLCYACHRGAEGYHNAKRAWVKRHGPDYMLLDAVASML